MGAIKSDCIANGASQTIRLKQKKDQCYCNFLNYHNAFTLFFSSRCVSLYHKCRCRTIYYKYQQCAQPFWAAVGRTFFFLFEVIIYKTNRICLFLRIPWQREWVQDSRWPQNPAEATILQIFDTVSSTASLPSTCQPTNRLLISQQPPRSSDRNLTWFGDKLRSQQS